MKILFVLGIGFDKEATSLHLFKSIFRACINDGVSVHAILAGEEEQRPYIPQDILNSGLFSFDTIKPKSAKKKNFIARYLNEIRYAHKCKKFLRKIENVDAAFVQSNTVLYSYTKVIKKTLSIPVILNVQDIFPNNLFEARNGKINRLLYRFLSKSQIKGYTMSNHIITISDDMKETISKMGVSSDKISVVFNWSYSDNPIQISEADNQIAKKFFNSDTYNVVYAGNVGLLQNVDFLLDAASSLVHEESIHFYIIGNGGKRAELQNKYGHLANVSFYDNQPSEFAEMVYSGGNLNIVPLLPGIIKTALPSKTATCLRAMVPVIFCIDKNSQFASLICKQNGVKVVDPSNVEELVECILCSKKESQTCIERDVIKSSMSSVVNPNKYVSIIKNVAQANVHKNRF